MAKKKRSKKTTRTSATKIRAAGLSKSSAARKTKGSKKRLIKQPSRPAPKRKKVARAASKISKVSLLAGTSQNCLEVPQAIALVRGCSRTPDTLPLSTPLGQIFPSDARRNSFCQCVADGV